MRGDTMIRHHITIVIIRDIEEDFRRKCMWCVPLKYRVLPSYHVFTVGNNIHRI